MATLPPEIAALIDALDAADQDARNVASGLDEARGAWRAAPGSWSVAECLDHLATTNHTYLEAMRPSAEQALAAGARRRKPARPGLLGSWFVRSMEPPVKMKVRAPRRVRPRPSPPLQNALHAFLDSEERVRDFLRQFAEIDLNGVNFPNPFIRGVRFSLATGIHVIPAHDRRHLWQAWNVRKAWSNA